MSSKDDAGPTPSEKLAAIIAARKAARGQTGGQVAPGDRRSEKAAAARSASKSKPALRK